MQPTEIQKQQLVYYTSTTASTGILTTWSSNTVKRESFVACSFRVFRVHAGLSDFTFVIEEFDRSEATSKHGIGRAKFHFALSNFGNFAEITQLQ